MLLQKLREGDVDALGDGVFGNMEKNIISVADMQSKLMRSIHKQNRARIECTFKELHAEAESTVLIWRHSRTTNPSSFLLACELFNFRKRFRMERGAELVKQTVSRINSSYD